MRFVSSGKLEGLHGGVRPPVRTKVQSTPSFATALKELWKLPVLVEEKEKTTPKNVYKPDEVTEKAKEAL